MDYDLCVIGAGWAGFNAAVKAAKLGKKVCCLEEKELGGTCLNRGCIPTKALVAYSKQGLTLEEIQRKKSDVVQRLKTGMASVFKADQVDYIEGTARIEADGFVSVAGVQKLKPKFILIATGSQPRDLPLLKIDHQKIISSDDVLELKDVPRKILIIGGGFIGCEFASIFKRLGVDVTIVELLPQLLPGFDAQVSKKLHQSFQKSGINVCLEKRAEEFKFDDFDKVLLAVGRKSVVEGLWDESIGIKLQNGDLAVDRELRTDVRNIFGAGDCIGGYMLAHVASYEGELAVNNMFSAPLKRDYSAVPCSVFTSPEIGSIGISEEEAKKFGLAYKASTVHFLSVGMAHILEDTQGFAKVIVDTKSGHILGAGIIGLEATELVNAFSILIKNKIPVAALRKTIFAHPSVSEIIAEVAKSFD